MSSQAESLLSSLYDSEEEHIVIGTDRIITVPDALKKIAVQFDHNMETVTFDCPRYWDGIDMSPMAIYINYECPDGTEGDYLADNVSVDTDDDSILHFTWTITRAVTAVAGSLVILVCIKQTDTDGNEIHHWNTERNTEMYVVQGLETSETITAEYPDIITQLLSRQSSVETLTSDYISNGSSGDHTVYQNLMDSSGDILLDDSGEELLATIVFPDYEDIVSLKNAIESVWTVIQGLLVNTQLGMQLTTLSTRISAVEQSIEDLYEHALLDTL